jgi:7-cyano-7-deazaguanine synthase
MAQLQVVMGLSGGMDSATLAGYYLDKGYGVVPVSFGYGSKHGEYENAAARKLAEFYGLEIHNIQLPFIGEQFKSNLLRAGGDIPEGHYENDNMALTVVPGRNVIFISIMMGLAWSLGASVVAVGAHAGDHAIYEDCRRSFIVAMDNAIREGSGGRVRLEAPFQDMTKTNILRIGYGLDSPVPYELTRTCYKDQKNSCGRCGSCVERLSAFDEIGQTDPIEYEDRITYKKYMEG